MDMCLDLDSIVSYIAVQLSNPKATGDFLDEVTACYGFLNSAKIGGWEKVEVTVFIGSEYGIIK